MLSPPQGLIKALALSTLPGFPSCQSSMYLFCNTQPRRNLWFCLLVLRKTKHNSSFKGVSLFFKNFFSKRTYHWVTHRDCFFSTSRAAGFSKQQNSEQAYCKEIAQLPLPPPLFGALKMWLKSVMLLEIKIYRAMRDRGAENADCGEQPRKGANSAYDARINHTSRWLSTLSGTEN